MKIQKNSKLVKTLTNLAQLDFDAAQAYDQALQNIDAPDIYQSITEFRNDYLRHIDDLSALIVRLHAKPPRRSKDIRGFLIKGFTAIRSAVGTKGALKAMKTNEELTSKIYKEALKDGNLIPEIRNVVEQNYADGMRHLKYLQETLASPEFN